MRRRVFALGIAATMTFLAGCSAGGDDGGDAESVSAGDSADGSSAVQEAPEGDEEGAPADEPASSGSGAGVITDAVQAATGRDIIYTIDVWMTVKDVPRAARDAASIAVGAGGFIASEQSTTGDATVTLKVPTTAQTEVVNKLEGLGKVTERSRSTQDVTQEVVDTESRIKSQQASIARIRQLLENATDLKQVIDIEGELADREADLDSLLSRQKELSALTSMATITATFYERENEPKVEEAETGFLAGLGNGWDAFVTSGGVFLTLIGALLPFALLAALIAIPTVKIVRQRRGDNPPVPEPAPETQ